MGVGVEGKKSILYKIEMKTIVFKSFLANIIKIKNHSTCKVLEI
jgi:hypothetical protein